jgi:hypothetical protein
MGRQTGDQSQLFYLFNLETRIAADHSPATRAAQSKSALRPDQGWYRHNLLKSQNERFLEKPE